MRNLLKKAALALLLVNIFCGFLFPQKSIVLHALKASLLLMMVYGYYGQKYYKNSNNFLVQNSDHQVRIHDEGYACVKKQLDAWSHRKKVAQWLTIICLGSLLVSRMLFASS